MAVGHKLQDGEAPDSFEMLDSWLGKSKDSRPYLLEEAFAYALRKDGWKYITPGTEAPDWLANKDIETGMETSPQLYKISEDQTEQQNLIEDNLEKASELEALWNEVKSGPTRK